MGNSYIVDDPEMIDSVIADIQKGLIKHLSWLDHAYGRAERLVKYDENRRLYYTPNVYVGNNDYREVSPDCRDGNFCFFWVDDPQELDWQARQSVSISVPFSIIFWFDFRRINNSKTIRNKEQIKKQIFDVLNNGILLQRGSYSFNTVYELAENIYEGFSLKEIENQFLMHPYGGFRFEGTLKVEESC